MTEAEEIYLAPEVEITEDEQEAFHRLIYYFQGLYTKEISRIENAGTTLPLEVAKSIGHWASTVAPLTSLSALLLESIDEHEDASDLALDASATIAAANSITSLMFDVLACVYRLHDRLNNDKQMSSHLADQAEMMLTKAGIDLPDLQLDLFEEGQIAR